MAIVIVLVIIGIIVLVAVLGSDKSNHSKNSSYSRENVYANYKGVIGEDRVSHILRALPDSYHVINNVIVPNQKSTSQIDHVVVSPFGIFVIETKNYSGWIFGSDNSEKWKETFRTTGGQFFRNPIKQNWAHVYALQEYLNIDKRVFKPIVVFSDDATLNVEADTPVINMSQLWNVIAGYNQQIISQKDVDDIYNRISKANLVGTENGNRHVDNVRADLRNKKTALEQGFCPQCGGRIVLRKGLYGEFYGCSNFPNCRYTRNIPRQ